VQNTEDHEQICKSTTHSGTQHLCTPTSFLRQQVFLLIRQS